MTISLIVITYNQNIQTQIVLDSISRQRDINFNELEVLVIDDGSDNVFVYRTKCNYKLKIIYSQNKGRAAARNLGLKEAMNEYVIFIDGDRVLADDFIGQYIKSFREYKKHIIIGRIREIYISKEVSMDIIQDKIQNKFYKIPSYNLNTDVIYDKDGTTESQVPWITTYSGNMGIERELINSVGGFDENFYKWGFEHFELGLRLFKKNIKFLRCNAINYHLAHKRDISEMKENISVSINYLMKKYNVKEIEKFSLFIQGHISLQDFEANKNADWLERCKKDVFIKIGKRGQ
jgi:Predicted glycosyltransferases